MPIGLCLPHRAAGADDALRLAVLAEALGYDSVWVSELATYDAYALACAIAARTERIAIGTAIVPVSTRTPALHAMSMSTLARLAPGRCIVGFGISTKPIIEGWHGQPGVVERALAHTRALWRELSALAEQAAGEPGDVVLPIRIGDGPDAERRFRREAASYLRVPPYERAIAGMGYPDVVPQGELQEMADALPAAFVEDMGILGDAAAKLDRMNRDGVTPLLVPIVAPGDLAGFERIARAAISG